MEYRRVAAALGLSAARPRRLSASSDFAVRGRQRPGTRLLLGAAPWLRSTLLREQPPGTWAGIRSGQLPLLNTAGPSAPLHEPDLKLHACLLNRIQCSGFISIRSAPDKTRGATARRYVSLRTAGFAGTRLCGFLYRHCGTRLRSRPRDPAAGTACEAAEYRRS